MEKTNTQFNASTRACNKLFQLSMFNLMFQYEVEQIYHKCKFKSDNLGYYVEPQNQLLFKKMVKNLAIKFNLSALPQKILYNYVLQKEDSFKALPNFSFSNDQKCIVYKIYHDTTIRDVKNDWSSIKILQEKINGGKIKKNYPSRNIKRDTEIFMLKEIGTPTKKITKIINAKYPKTIVGYADIPKIIQRLINSAR
jgi:hypothetical protein